jgi:peptide deformylase
MSMEPFSIVYAGDEVLRQRAADVSLDAEPALEETVARMIATMRDAPGVGLAAPQVGLSTRLIVLEDRAEYLSRVTPERLAQRERCAFDVRVFVNPTLTPIGDKRVTFHEGCLSVPGYSALVERYHEVEVSGLDQHGVAQRWRVHGWPARILQHEVDHIDGILYIDRMITRSFSIAEPRSTPGKVGP